MNLNLKIHNNFKDNMINKIETVPYEGVIYEFDFGKYKVDVFKTLSSDGSEKDLWEVQIIKDGAWWVNFDLFYDDNVMGELTDKEVNIVLYCVKNELLSINFDKIRGAIEIFNTI